MAWNPQIPQGGDLINQSQSDLLGNFQAIGTLFNGQNLVLQPQAANPAQDATGVQIYSKTSTLGALGTQLFIERETGSGYPSSVVEFTSAGFSGSNGWTYLPSGLLLKWGGQTVAQAGHPTPYLYTFPFNFGGATVPNINTLLTTQLTPTWNGSTANLVVINFAAYDAGAKTITVRIQGNYASGGGDISFSYFLIGY